MNAYLVAACALIASLVPPGIVCLRGRPIEGAVALQLCGSTGTLALLCVFAGVHRPSLANVALVAAVATFLNTLVIARMLGQRS